MEHRVLKEEDLKGAVVVVVWSEGGLSAPDEVLQEWVRLTGNPDLLCFMLRPGEDISLISEKEMAEHGWVRRA